MFRGFRVRLQRCDIRGRTCQEERVVSKAKLEPGRGKVRGETVRRKRDLED